ncbi:hypothetical protein GCM10022378_01960 [Salinicoccus jeotgali]|uniref:Uncharacterized protein n=1 Tax=Salinicoccus jeotgali TaxID=381634 RepID=A0ABP7E6I9_9STAP
MIEEIEHNLESKSEFINQLEEGGIIKISNDKCLMVKVELQKETE